MVRDSVGVFYSLPFATTVLTPSWKLLLVRYFVRETNSPNLSS